MQIARYPGLKEKKILTQRKVGHCLVPNCRPEALCVELSGELLGLIAVYYLPTFQANKD